jgi:uncharacterized protein (DUF1330 family)
VGRAWWIEIVCSRLDDKEPLAARTGVCREDKVGAYVVIDRLVVIDGDQLRAYTELATASVKLHGGRYVTPHRTGIESLEGNWKPHRIVLIEFASAERARQWWNSPEYAQARAIHRAATISNVLLLDGTPDSSSHQGVPDHAQGEEKMP